MRRYAATVAVTGGILCLLVAARHWDISQSLRQAAHGTAELGLPGYAVFAGLYVLGCLLLLPGSALTLVAGAVYGLAHGAVLVWLSATAGATAAFLVGRHLARGWVASRLAADPRFAALDAAVGREGFKIVVLTRLSPVFPFNILNYAFGLTTVSLKAYVLGSGLGMLPGTLLYVYLGSLARHAIAPDRPTGPWVWSVRVLGLLATLAVSVAAARLARGALRQADPGGRP